MRRALLLILATAVCGPALAASFYVSPDVPLDLSGAIRPPWSVLRNDNGNYGTVITLPAGSDLDALHRLDGGDWLISVDAPSDLGGTTYDRRDVIRFDGIGYSLALGGAASGIPAGSNVDSLFRDGGDGGDLVLSFDVPTTLDGATYEPADLVRYSAGSFSLFFDASATSPSIPITSNVTGADQRGPLTILSFDVPTTLGGTTYLPGELVSWDGVSYATYDSGGAWPIAGRVAALALLADPGLVAATLEVAKSTVTPGDLRLSWAPSCSAGGEDYGIYEGEMGAWDGHVWADCSDDGGDLREEINPSPGDRFYLVVPRNANDEGSYGTGSNGVERAVGISRCVGSQAISPCP